MKRPRAHLNTIIACLLTVAAVTAAPGVQTGQGAVTGLVTEAITGEPILEVLHGFAGGDDGERPVGPLIQATDGDFYGITINGGGSGQGTVFKMTPSGTVTVLHAFTGGMDGAHPSGFLIQATDGDLYGTTSSGGASDLGTVFKITPAGVVTILHTFSPGVEGAFPSGDGLIQGTDGDFYGTTAYGGVSGRGSVFKMTPAGIVTVLHEFSGGADGWGPNSSLTQATDGDFYGTTDGGGISGQGTVFKMTSAGDITTLHSFTGDPDGALPYVGLTQAHDGDFYGTTGWGGESSFGTLFKMTPAGDVTVLHSFTYFEYARWLIEATDGNFYGTTSGAPEDYNGGSIFRLTPAGAFATLQGFDVFGPGPSNPAGGLIQGTDGNFYGTTYGGGLGSVFRLTVDLELTTNGNFSNGMTGWLTFATPEASYFVGSVVGGVLEFYRQPPPLGTTNQAVVFQGTGVALGAATPFAAKFDLGNSSSERKRIAVIIADFDFNDVAVCTFWIPAGAPMRTYRMYSHTIQAWGNAAIFFYAATAGAAGGAYRLDNVSLRPDFGVSDERTDCVDPVAPTPLGGAPGPDLIVNGSFGSGLPPWVLFGTIQSQIADGVFEFTRPSATPPAGVVLQPTNVGFSAGTILGATFQLGNSSGVRRRVTVILHDLAFEDLAACTFWLAPGQPLSAYEMRTFATQAWTNATVSVYAATVGTEQWIRLDSVTLRQTPGQPVLGTECVEPATPFADPRGWRMSRTPGGTTLGAEATAAIAINASGDITGAFRDLNGGNHGYLLTRKH